MSLHRVACTSEVAALSRQWGSCTIGQTRGTFSELRCDAANPTESMPKLPPKTARQPRLERRESTDSRAQSRGFIHSAIRLATDGGQTASSGDCGPECGHRSETP